jgi:hypothetical protein
MARKPTISILSVERLRTLPTHRLLAVLRSVRAVLSSIYHYRGSRCCELCHEYIGDDWERDVKAPARPLEAYQSQIKEILSTRPHLHR